MTVVLVANGTQNLEKHTRRSGVEAIQVSGGADAADFAIVERVTGDDIVVTQDIGVAAMVLGRGAGAISPRGRIFYQSTIDIEMEVRHAEAKHRRAGGRTGGPRAFTDEDREHFTDQLERLINDKRRG